VCRTGVSIPVLPEPEGQLPIPGRLGVSIVPHMMGCVCTYRAWPAACIYHAREEQVLLAKLACQKRSDPSYTDTEAACFSTGAASGGTLLFSNGSGGPQPEPSLVTEVEEQLMLYLSQPAVGVQTMTAAVGVAQLPARHVTALADTPLKRPALGL
jgi:hypothetical protein